MQERILLEHLRSELLKNGGSITEKIREKYTKQLSKFGYSMDGISLIIKSIQQHVIDEIEFRKTMEEIGYSNDEIKHYADAFNPRKYAYKAFVELREYPRDIFDRCLKDFERQKLELVRNNPKDILSLFITPVEFLEKYLTEEELKDLTEKALNDVNWFIETEHYIFIDNGDESEC